MDNEEKEGPRKSLPEEAKELIRESLPEKEPEVEIPIPETKGWIEEQADGKQQEKEWKQRETLPEAKPLIDLDKKIVRNVRIGDARKESAPPEKLNHPLQAYSYSMKEPEPVEKLMWDILNRIDRVASITHTANEVYFELGQIYQEYFGKLRKFVETKEEEFEAKKLGDKPE